TTINWGDGTAPTIGAISLAGNTFSVTGTHTYAAAGSFSGTVTILDEGGSQTTANLSVFVLSTIPTGNVNERFVAQVYRVLLHREADPGGAAVFRSLLDKGISRSDVALGIESSPEYRNLFVDSLYQTYLGRPADPFGLNTFVAFLGA